jgi:hypothetical protein
MTREEVAKGTVVCLPRSESASLLRIVSEPIHHSYNDIDYVGFLAYRVRKNGASFGNSKAYLVKLRLVTVVRYL